MNEQKNQQNLNKFILIEFKISYNIKMLEKFKNTFKEIKQSQPKQQPPVKQIKINIQTVNILTPEEIKNYKKLVQTINEDLNYIKQISSNNKQSIKEFIKQQIQTQKSKAKPSKQGQQQDQYTLPQDMNEIKQIITTVFDAVKKIEVLQTQAKFRIQKNMPIQKSQADHQKVASLQAKILKYEEDIKRNKQNDAMQRQMFQTLKQQCTLYTQQIKKLQQKVSKLQREVEEKKILINNINQQKKMLLEMKNLNTPELEGLKGQIQEFQKRLVVEKTKNQQKDKEIQSLKKKIQQERVNLEGMADQLKQKQLKSKKITQKYDRSKQQVRKYREQKTELIKNLNIQISTLKQKLQKMESLQANYQTKINQKTKQIEQIKNKYQNVVSNNIKSLNLEDQLKTLSENHKIILQELQQYKKKVNDLTTQCEKLQEKRQSLLSVLDKPIKHEIRTIQKIHKTMNELYKDFIMEVFQKERNSTVVFQRKITTIMANLLQLKQDLLL